jgi:thiamine kinase-like enzyme
MKDLPVIYFDLMEVPADITSILSIRQFGKLRYRKTTLFQYTENIFRENQLTHFHRITDKNQLPSLIDHITYSPSRDYIFIGSNLTIIDKQAFGIFLKKIQYLDDSLALSDGGFPKPLLKLNKAEILDLLNLILTDDSDLYELLAERFAVIEKFTQETFFLEIRNYVDFVRYLQSNFELRYFNSIQSTKNIITKRSEQKDKMLREYSLYQFLNDEMRLFFLRPFAYREHTEFAEYSLERLNILDVSVQWIHFSITGREFENLMERLFYFLSIRKRQPARPEQIDHAIENVYLLKLEKRVRELQAMPQFEGINQLIRHSTDYDSVEAVMRHYKQIYGRMASLKNYPAYLAMGHGDLCFSNMLYDKRIDYLKLIDPKGCLAEEEAYMDVYYDLAKLSHSVLGNYDFINNGLFELSYDNNLRVQLEIQGLEELTEKKNYFRNFVQKQGFSYPHMRLYEASLFLSMLPLHIDYPKKVIAYLLTGIEILKELEGIK